MHSKPSTSGKLHVAVIGDWHDDVHVLANSEAAKEHLIRVLRVAESEGFVFQG